MKTIGKFASKKLAIGAFVPLLAVTVLAATPADAQSRYRDNDRGRDRDSTAQNAILGAVVGGVAGALIGNGDGSYVAGGALAGAALGATASNRGSGCEYYRGGRCYRNQGHWEREHNINSRDGYGYRYDNGRYGQDYRRNDRYNDRRDYRYDRRW